jgi:hypothetical protein
MSVNAGNTTAKLSVSTNRIRALLSLRDFIAGQRIRPVRPGCVMGK